MKSHLNILSSSITSIWIANGINNCKPSISKKMWEDNFLWLSLFRRDSNRLKSSSNCTLWTIIIINQTCHIHIKQLLQHSKGQNVNWASKAKRLLSLQWCAKFKVTKLLKMVVMPPTENNDDHGRPLSLEKVVGKSIVESRKW